MSGRLIYTMGPSGAGKDTLLTALAQRLGRRAVLARRVVTRAPTHTEPASHSASLQQFQQQVQAGDFALSWQANGLHYGISRQIDAQLAQGKHVMVNGSRAYLAQAWARYPTMLGVLITASHDVLASRLMRRARETPDQISARLQRNQRTEFVWPGPQEAWVTVDNSGDVQTAVDLLYAWLDARVPAVAAANQKETPCV